MTSRSCKFKSCPDFKKNNVLASFCQPFTCNTCRKADGLALLSDEKVRDGLDYWMKFQEVGLLSPGPIENTCGDAYCENSEHWVRKDVSSGAKETLNTQHDSVDTAVKTSKGSTMTTFTNSRRCRYDDCVKQGVLAVDDEQVTCEVCRKYMGLAPLPDAIVSTVTPNKNKEEEKATMTTSNNTEDLHKRNVLTNLPRINDLMAKVGMKGKLLVHENTYHGDGNEPNTELVVATHEVAENSTVLFGNILRAFANVHTWREVDLVVDTILVTVRAMSN